MTVYVNKPPATFIHIPKNAGTSISNWLIDNCNGHWLSPQDYQGKHKNLHQIIERLPTHKHLGFKFAVVRNPWDRVLSCYFYYQKKGNRVVEGLSFEQYVLETDLGIMKRQQVEYFDNGKGLVMEAVLRYESLESDFKVVQDYMNVTAPLPLKNSSGGATRDYKDFYTPKMIDKVARIAADDIRTLGYDY